MEYSPHKKQSTCINRLDIQISPIPPRSVDSERPSTVSNNPEEDGASSLLKSWQRWGFSGVKLTRQHFIKGKRRCWWSFSCMLIIVPSWEHQSTLSTNSKQKSPSMLTLLTLEKSIGYWELKSVVIANSTPFTSPNVPISSLPYDNSVLKTSSLSHCPWIPPSSWHQLNHYLPRMK